MNASRVSELEVELCEAKLQLNGVKDKFEAEVKATQHLKASVSPHSTSFSSSKPTAST